MIFWALILTHNKFKQIYVTITDSISSCVFYTFLRGVYLEAIMHSTAWDKMHLFFVFYQIQTRSSQWHCSESPTCTMFLIPYPQTYINVETRVNPYHAEFLKWNSPSYIFGTFHNQFRDIKMKTWKLVTQQHRAWSDCMDVQADMALYWCQRLITFGVGRIRVKWIYPRPRVSNLKEWEQKRSMCFFTYIHLNLFHSHSSNLDVIMFVRFYGKKIEFWQISE